MFSKVVLLLKNKIAIAVAGAILVALVGSTAALAATGTPLPLISQGHPQQTQHQGNGAANDQGKSQDDDKNDTGHQAAGAISSIDAGHNSFVVADEHGKDVTIAVNAQTMFVDGLHSFADLKVGMRVEVKGNLQADGTLTATRIEGENNTSGDDHGDANTSDGSSNNTGTGSDDGHSGSSSPDSGSGSHSDNTSTPHP